MAEEVNIEEAPEAETLTISSMSVETAAPDAVENGDPTPGATDKVETAPSAIENVEAAPKPKSRTRSRSKAAGKTRNGETSTAVVDETPTVVGTPKPRGRKKKPNTLE
jgi:hypothetical protein